MNIHFVGTGGSGISGVAKLAEKMGYEVTGCDIESSTAYAKNIFQGHSSSHLKNADLVVVSPALYFNKEKIDEIEMARKDGKLMTWQEFLGRILLKDKKIICIAGTHGKSTTTAMAGQLLVDNGFDPIVMVGAFVPEWGENSRFGHGKYAVIEADEFNNNFLNYFPDIAVINNIEFDHPDFFENKGEVKESFKKFVGNLKGEKLLITEGDSLGKKFNLKILGEHNQKNANMVYLLGRKLGLSDQDIVRSLENFEGIGRRMELIGEKNGIKIFDDYAHHPTAIKTTLKGLRNVYPNSKILAIVEPHGYKRTKALLQNYKGIFDAADKVIIGPIFKARDEVDSSVSPELIAKVSGHKNALGFDIVDKTIGDWRLEIGDFDIVVVMGAGKSYLWAREILNSLEDGIKENVSFRDLTALKIGGEIKYYKEVKNKDEVVRAVKFAKANNLPIFILGDGTDILASDNEFKGLVVKYTGKSLNVKSQMSKVNVTAEAGMNWDELVGYAVKEKLQGIECLSGIPGTVGAAPIQNIGAYGQELKDTFVSLEAYDIEKEKFRTFSLQDCEFGYRESVFKKKDCWQKYIICSITLKLNKNSPAKINYDSLKKHITSGNPTLTETRNTVIDIRFKKLENPKIIPNAGSFFKNSIIDSEEKEKLENKFPEIKTFPFQNKFKVSAASLIENAGWKGKTYKGVGVSSKHALVIINPSFKASAREVIELSGKIEADVYKKYGIKLVKEVQLINF